MCVSIPYPTLHSACDTEVSLPIGQEMQAKTGSIQTYRLNVYNAMNDKGVLKIISIGGHKEVTTIPFNVFSERPLKNAAL